VSRPKADRAAAGAALERTSYDVRRAVLVLRFGITADEAATRLLAADGRLKRALGR